MSIFSLEDYLYERIDWIKKYSWHWTVGDKDKKIKAFVDEIIQTLITNKIIKEDELQSNKRTTK